MKKNILIVITCIIVLWSIFFITDYTRAKNDKNPIFCIPGPHMNDGGSREFVGWGYKVMNYNKLEGRKDSEIKPVWSSWVVAEDCGCD